MILRRQAGTFKAGIGVRMLKQEVVPVPEAVIASDKM
jgi:hypothetical protein